MSFELTSRKRRGFGQPSWSGAAFLVEALVLLVFLAVSVGLLVQLYAHAADQATESRDLSRAVAAATETAECFAADPASAPDVAELDGMTVTCTVTPEQTGGGTLYHATIQVFSADAGAGSGGEPVYELSTARYVGGDGR